jgi:hypothetical protein
VGFPGDTAGPGSSITTATCNPGDASQTLAFSSATGLVTHTPTGLCIDANVHMPANEWCLRADHATWPICDPTQALDVRAADLVGRLTLADKIAALGTGTPQLPSVGLPGEA